MPPSPLLALPPDVFQIILVDSNPDHMAKGEVDTFLHVMMDDHTQDQHSAATILALLRSQLAGVRVAGCLTFWEDFVPLAAMVAEGLNLSHATPFKAAMNAKSKALTQSVLRSQDRRRSTACHHASSSAPL